jgi:uncharacterized lipoprotein YddW (UPF0748 family)
MTGPERIRAFCIDFNWDLLDRFASPGLYAHADPARHLAWYRELGVNTVQSFFVAHNGYAWYDSDLAPRTPGMPGDFMATLTALGHEAGLGVMGYFSPGANGSWAVQHPDLSHRPSWNRWHIPFTTPYLDYLSRLIEEALRRIPVDGFMVDLLWNVDPVWMDCERTLYREVMGERLAPAVTPPPDVTLEYGRRATERAWVRIRETAKSLRPDCVLWLSVNNLHNPQLAGTRISREVDWLMNEHPDVVEGLTIARDLAGPSTRLVQCVCGWEGPTGHNADQLLAAIPDDVGLYGFAQPDPATTLPLADGGVTARNIAALQHVYRGER